MSPGQGFKNRELASPLSNAGGYLLPQPARAGGRMFFSMFVGAFIAAGAIGVSEEFATLHASCGPLGCSFAVSSSTAQFMTGTERATSSD